MGKRENNREYEDAREEMNRIAKRDRYESPDLIKAEKRVEEAEKNVSKAKRFFSN